MEIMDEMVEAFRFAFNDIREVSGQQGDQELAKYEKLDKAGFDHIRKEYGMEHLVGYIRRMEARRQGVK